MTKDELIVEIDNKINKLTGWKWDYSFGLPEEKTRFNNLFDLTCELKQLVMDYEEEISSKG